MGLRITSLIPFLFIGLALVLFAASTRAAAGSIARRTRARIGWIFLAVGIGLLILARYG